MELSEESLFVIKTLALFSTLSKLLTDGGIAKEQFQVAYEATNDAQKTIIDVFLKEEKQSVQNLQKGFEEGKNKEKV